MNEPRLSEQEDELRSTARNEFASAPDSQSDAELIGSRPNFFRAWYSYPEGPDSFEVALREKESRTAPFAADVSIEKVRYSTPLRRTRERAREEESVRRSKGTETVTYEWRNGRWRRISSLFVADATEELVNGEWAPVRPQQRDVLSVDESRRSWIGRTWDAIRFWQ